MRRVIVASNSSKTLKIDGMTCVNCENKIEKKLRGTKGIVSVKAAYSASTVKVTFDEGVISLKKIAEIIEKLDYKVINTPQKAGRGNDFSKLIGAVIIIFALYLLINHFGGFSIFNVFPQAQVGMNYGFLFVIGLLTSLHCVAMCGGINISQCVPKKQESSAAESKFAAISPGILYNLGRVISYTVIGGIVGALGSVISFSGTAKGFVMLIAGVFMVIMGLNMLNIFPWLRKLNPRMPKVFASKINKQKKSKSPLYIGLLNGLMPCGPLQAMQIYALSTGSPVKGALSMFLFSLGTVPLMFGLGALSTLVTKKFSSRMIAVSAALVIVLGVFMFSNGVNLTGYVAPSIEKNNTVENKTEINAVSEYNNVAIIKGGVQNVTTKLYPNAYEAITVQKGIPVKWVIKAGSSDINGCNGEMIIPEYNKDLRFAPGDNIIEFTPTKSGTFGYSCWMGMINSKITVVDDIKAAG